MKASENNPRTEYETITETNKTTRPIVDQYGTKVTGAEKIDLYTNMLITFHNSIVTTSLLNRCIL
jgi:hypothetical protein